MVTLVKNENFLMSNFKENFFIKVVLRCIKVLTQKITMKFCYRVFILRNKNTNVFFQSLRYLSCVCGHKGVDTTNSTWKLNWGRFKTITFYGLFLVKVSYLYIVLRPVCSTLANFSVCRSKSPLCRKIWRSGTRGIRTFKNERLKTSSDGSLFCYGVW